MKQTISIIVPFYNEEKGIWEIDLLDESNTPKFIKNPKIHL
jgi:hypothetical protein